MEGAYLPRPSRRVIEVAKGLKGPPTFANKPLAPVGEISLFLLSSFGGENKAFTLAALGT